MEKEKYYLIERNGEMVGLPESLLTDAERVKIINELRKQGKDHFEHADELKGIANHFREVAKLTKPKQ